MNMTILAIYNALLATMAIVYIMIYIYKRLTYTYCAMIFKKLLFNSWHYMNILLELVFHVNT